MVEIARWPYDDCSRCGGDGIEPLRRGSRPCLDCAGTGRIASGHRPFLHVETATTAELLVLRKSTDKAVL